MTKVIKIDDRNYKCLLTIIHELECASNKRASFDDALSLLINEHEKRSQKQINKEQQSN